MKALDLANLIRFKTRTNTSTFTNADMLEVVNFVQDEIASLIVERNSDMFNVPYTFDLIADQREYRIGDDVLNRLHKVEIKFDEDDSRFPARYIKDYQGSETESEIIKNFSNTRDEFAYTIRRRGILILSGTITAVTDGVRMWSHVYPERLTDMTENTRDLEVDPSTTTFGFPRQFHELWARRVGMEWKSRQPKPLPFSPLENQYDRDLELQLRAISHRDNSGEIIAQLPPSQDLYNDGWDL